MDILTGWRAEQRFSEMIIQGSLVIEHGPNNTNVIGRTTSAGVSLKSNNFFVAWYSPNGEYQETMFDRRYWEIEIVHDTIIFIKKTSEGQSLEPKQPLDGCVLYTIFFHYVR
jgi:hypothetical protein